MTESKLRTAGCLDRDGDGYGALSDASCLSAVPECNDGAAGYWGTPGPTINLRFTSKTTLFWDRPTSPGAVASVLVFDTIRSSVAGNFMLGVCVESDNGPNLTAADASTPSIGEVFYYLNRAQNACPAGVGSLGTNSSGTERAGVSCP